MSDPILDLPMRENDAGAKTIREYLKVLLLKVWHKREGFNGKRPFGNSGWEYDLYEALIEAKAVDGKLDHDGMVEQCDDPTADRLIAEAIERLV